MSTLLKVIWNKLLFYGLLRLLPDSAPKAKVTCNLKQLQMTVDLRNCNTIVREDYCRDHDPGQEQNN
ncbi:MAG: hypothetical protein C4516_02225 [Oxalobacter sp.]|nr:MAG: hypothetical protein C4516_02225 [Oxalobacter sp.]